MESASLGVEETLREHPHAQLLVFDALVRAMGEIRSKLPSIIERGREDLERLVARAFLIVIGEALGEVRILVLQLFERRSGDGGFWKRTLRFPERRDCRIEREIEAHVNRMEQEGHAGLCEEPPSKWPSGWKVEHRSFSTQSGLDVAAFRLAGLKLGSALLLSDEGPSWLICIIPEEGAKGNALQEIDLLLCSSNLKALLVNFDLLWTLTGFIFERREMYEALESYHAIIAELTARRWEARRPTVSDLLGALRGVEAQFAKDHRPVPSAGVARCLSLVRRELEQQVGRAIDDATRNDVKEILMKARSLASGSAEVAALVDEINALAAPAQPTDKETRELLRIARNRVASRRRTRSSR